MGRALYCSKSTSIWSSSWSEFKSTHKPEPLSPAPTSGLINLKMKFKRFNINHESSLPFARKVIHHQSSRYSPSFPVMMCIFGGILEIMRNLATIRTTKDSYRVHSSLSVRIIRSSGLYLGNLASITSIETIGCQWSVEIHEKLSLQ